MRVWVRWVFALLVAGFTLGVPAAYYRATYAHAKRLRVIDPGKAYRCGELTAAGFREAVRRYGIKVIINLQQDNRDPFLAEVWQTKPSIRESELCKQLGVEYVVIDGGDLSPAPDDPDGRPKAIDDFLRTTDDALKRGKPFLFHCHAGRDRTGLFTAVYRMEYNHRSKAEAVRELRGNGFAAFAATEANVYMKPFITDYEPGVRRGQLRAANALGANGKGR